MTVRFPLVLLILAVFSPSPAISQEPGQQPNIIVILADDLGWADVGYHGSDIATPHIDAMAEKAVKLERHYVHPYCLPTRLALLTGDYPGRTDNRRPARGDASALPAKSMARALADAGYDTHIVGKWHLGADKATGPLKYGFATSYGSFDAHADPYFHDTASRAHVWHRNDEELWEEGHATDLMTAEALRIVSAPRDKPYFLYLAYTAPHWPLAAPERWTDYYAGKDVKNPEFAAMVSHLDESLGRLFRQLEKTNPDRDTILVFASDNGAEARSDYTDSIYDGIYGDRYGLQTAFGDNSPLRGNKGSVYEGDIRVPSFVWWRSQKKSMTISTPLQVEDWFPTFMALAGKPGAASGPGMDIRNILKGAEPGTWNREFYTRSTWPYPMWALRQGKIKMVVKLEPAALGLQSFLQILLPKSQEWRIGSWFGNTDISDSDRLKVEFYDIVADPAETNDLAATIPEVQRQAFLDKLNAYRSRDTNLNNSLCLPPMQ